MLAQSSDDNFSRLFSHIATESRERIIDQFVRIRQDGILFYGGYLEEFYLLDEEAQLTIALVAMPEVIDTEIKITEILLSDEYIDLVKNLRVPQEMIEAILAEAAENGADDFFEIPGFEEGLQQLRNEGNIGAETVGYIIEKAPDTTSKLYIVVVSLATIEREEDARQREEDARQREINQRLGTEALGRINRELGIED